MTTCSCDLSHDGKSWVLKVIPAETAECIDLKISDAQKVELEKAGVNIYTGE
jgi:hypothetical protein